MCRLEKILTTSALSLAVATLGGRAHAQEEAEAPPAMQYYQNAQDLYEQGRYREAAEELERARALDPGAPELLYNLALIYERLSDFDRAIERLQSYSVFELDGEERERVERMMARLEGAREHQPEPDQAAPSTRVVVRRMGRADGWFWAMVGVTAACSAAAVVTGTMALVYGQEAEAFAVDAHNRIEYDWLVDTSRAMALSTDVLIGLAGAAALTGLLLYVLRERPGGEAAEEQGADGWMEGDGEAPASEAPPRSAMPSVAPLLGRGLGGVLLGWEL